MFRDTATDAIMHHLSRISASNIRLSQFDRLRRSERWKIASDRRALRRQRREAFVSVGLSKSLTAIWAIC